MQAGDLLGGKYRLERRLGRGGMGEVWVASDDALGRQVAIKIVLADLSNDTVLIQRLRGEARTAAALHHPGITIVHDIGEHDAHPYFVMELLEGRDFTQVLGDYPGGMPVPRAVGLMLKVADALTYAHGKGVVHRDIKPANLMELTDGSVRICDFGIARYSDATAQLTATGGLLGTPAFMAPELYEGKPADSRSDLYAFGCTLHALLAGEPPFSAPSLASLMRQHLVEAPPKLPALRPGIPADLDELLQALLAKDPSHRPTGRDVMGALEDVLSPNTDKTRRASTWNRQPTQGTEHPPPMPSHPPAGGAQQQSHPSFPNVGQPSYGQQQSHPSFPQMQPQMQQQPQPQMQQPPPPFQQSHPSFPQMQQPAAYAQQSGYVQGQPVYGAAPVVPYRPVALPYGEVDPRTGQVMSDKSKLTAGLLQIFLGAFGVGRFYTGHVGMAIGQIAVTWLTCGFGALWPLIDGIVLLASGGTDAQGRRLRD